MNGVADALARNDGDAALAALEGMRRLDPAVTALSTAVITGKEVSRVAPMHWRVREQAAAYVEAAVHLDYAVRNCRVLARRAQVLLRARHECPPELIAAVRALGAAMVELENFLAGRTEARVAQAALVDIFAAARGSVQRDSPETVVAFVAQVRSIVYDILRATGLNRLDALALLEG